MRRIAVADGHAAKEDMRVVDAEQFLHIQAPLRPDFLRATVQPGLAQQQHDGLQPHAHVAPLRRAHIFARIGEQLHRRAKAIEIAHHLADARGLVLTRDLQRAVHGFAHAYALALMPTFQPLGIDIIFGLAALGRGGDAALHLGGEIGQRLAGQDNGVPRLRIAARRRAPRGFEHLLQHRGIDRLVEEMADRAAAGDGLRDVHRLTPPRTARPAVRSSCRPAARHP